MNASLNMQEFFIVKPDLDSPENIRQFIDRFYAKVLNDELLAPIFLDVAQIDLDVHIPIICSYWEKLLLGDKRYNRHTMNIHREVHKKHPLTEKEFERWLGYFKETARTYNEGPKTDRAVQLATSIAYNMDVQLNNKINVEPPPRSRH